MAHTYRATWTSSWVFEILIKSSEMEVSDDIHTAFIFAKRLIPSLKFIIRVPLLVCLIPRPPFFNGLWRPCFIFRVQIFHLFSILCSIQCSLKIKIFNILHRLVTNLTFELTVAVDFSLLHSLIKSWASILNDWLPAVPPSPCNGAKQSVYGLLNPIACVANLFTIARKTERW